MHFATSSTLPAPASRAPPKLMKKCMYEDVASSAQSFSRSLTMRAKMEALIREKQEEIIDAIEKIDGKKFTIDKWVRPDGTGEGITSVIEDGNVFERGGVNISIVHGLMPEAGIKKMRENHAALRQKDATVLPYWVCGLSLILHPKNPMAPTVHLNYRYFETQNEDGSPQAWWFGGGTDLTPTYLFDEDAKFFHQSLKQACDQHDPSYYPEFKAWCDRYFVNTHRGESRGIGGIFFDDLVDENPDKIYGFVKSCLESFLPTYMTILNRRKDMPYTPDQKLWQQIRRGRYVEFNLVHDRGTAFGLHTPNSRIESILVSMPLQASWRYDFHPEPGSEEERLIKVLKSPIDWTA